ncbi:MAG: hypothetical protein U5K37_06780 [Natrialbaceae archaeon]|nr:hypothetical protein [Natrialbaceae archaeon]
MLVGAVAVSIILLSLVVLFNGILFAETVSSSHSKDAATRALVVEHELEQAAQGIVDREYDLLAHPVTIGPTETALEDHADLYSQTMLNSRPAKVEFESSSLLTAPREVRYTYHSQELSVELVVEVTA